MPPNGEREALKSFSTFHDRIQPAYISPYGTYFVDIGSEGSGRDLKQIIRLTNTDSLESILDMNTSRFKKETSYVSDPDACSWSKDEKFLACWHNASRDSLVLFDVLKQYYIYI